MTKTQQLWDIRGLIIFGHLNPSQIREADKRQHQLIDEIEEEYQNDRRKHTESR